MRAAAAADWARAASASRIAAQVHDAARTDDLTGALRRASGTAALRQRIKDCRRRGEGLLLVFSDVDGMKQINDHQGHQAGDRLLAAVAAELRASVRAEDVVMRFGGDEFVFCMGETAHEDVVDRVERVQHALGAQHGTSVSAGYAALRDGEDLEDLIARADLDLYQQRFRREAAKDPGRPVTRDAADQDAADQEAVDQEAADQDAVDHGALAARLADALADLARITGSTYVSRDEQPGAQAAGLTRALHDHRVIEQATGILAQHGQIDIGAASSALHAHARTADQPVPEVAAAIVAGKLPLWQVAVGATGRGDALPRVGVSDRPHG